MHQVEMHNNANTEYNSAVMSLEESRRTQRPYRYGMILLCLGALVNWLGLAENYSEPIRYAGVGCILAGALLICTAMCCWLHTPNRTGSAPNNDESDDPIHVITISDDPNRREKPPSYDTVAIAPPSYDDAIKLDPAALLSLSNDNLTSVESFDTNRPSSSTTLAQHYVNLSDVHQEPRRDSSSHNNNSNVNREVMNESPPPYTAPS